MRNLILACWALLISHKIFLFRRSEYVDIHAGPDAVLPELLVLSCILGGTLLALSGRLMMKDSGFLKARGAASWLVLYTLAASASIVWAPSVVFAGAWALTLISATTLLVLYFEHADVGDCDRFASVSAFAMLPYPAYVFIGYFTLPLRPDMRVDPLGIHPNICSIIGFSMGTFLLCRALQRQKGAITYLVLAGLFYTSAFLTANKTAALATSIFLMILVAFAWRILTRIRAMIVTAIGIAIGLAIVYRTTTGLVTAGIPGHLQAYQMMGMGEDSPFFTVYSRYIIWQNCLELFSSSPRTILFGNGFTYVRQIGIPVVGEISMRTAHNSYLQVLTDTGIAGLIPIVVMVFSLLARSLRRIGDIADSASFPILMSWIVLFLVSFTSSDFAVIDATTCLFLSFNIAADTILRSESASSGGPA